MIHLPHHLSDPWPPTCSLATPATLAFLMFLELVSLVPSLGLCTCCVPCLDCIPSKGSNPTLSGAFLASRSKPATHPSCLCHHTLPSLSPMLLSP